MPEQLMDAIQVYQYGGPEELKLEQIPSPAPQPGEVLVRVAAAGVLPAEWKVRQGLFRAFRPSTFPYIPGSAIAGSIEGLGPGVTTYQIGQRVFGRSVNGAYAEFTTTAVEPPALGPNTFSLLAEMPEGLGFDEAATVSGGATTAWAALLNEGALRAGQRVLIHGGAGGVGSYAVQFAHWKGAQVIATASAANLDFVRSLGAETVIDYGATPFEDIARDVDVVLDTIGGDTLNRSFAVLKPGGILISLLEEPSLELARQYGVRATKNTLAPTNDDLRAIGRLIADGKVSATISRTFPLRDAAQAHDLSQHGHGRGRIILRIPG